MFTALPSVCVAMIAAANANSLLSSPSRDRFDPRPESQATATRQQRVDNPRPAAGS